VVMAMVRKSAGIEVTGNVRVVWNISSGEERKFVVNKRAVLDIMTQESANQAALVQCALKKLPVCQNPIKPVVR